MSKRVVTYLAELQFDLRDYRTILERIFSRKLTRSRDSSKYFFEVLVRASNLYRDYLTIRKLEPEINRQDDKAPNSPAATYTFKRRPGVTQEASMRHRFRERIESLDCWQQFQPKSEFVAENQLRTLQDYINTLALHLPEIYGETFNLESSVKSFREKKDSSAVREIIVGLGHIAHHVSYCHYALETLSDEWRWN